MSKNTERTVAYRVLFLVYCAVMLWLLFGQRWGDPSYLAQHRMNINLVPLYTIKQYFSLLHYSTYRWHAVVNLVGNILVFIPMGYLLPRIWKKFQHFLYLFLAVALMVIFVELLQYVTLLGSCDIDDLLLNLIGAVVGYSVWRIKCPKPK